MLRTYYGKKNLIIGVSCVFWAYLCPTIETRFIERNSTWANFKLNFDESGKSC